MRQHVVIAIDGLAATGKGTLARGLAHELGLVHRETGALYRAVGLMLLEGGLDPRSADDAERCARKLDLHLLTSPMLGSETVAHAGSLAAAHVKVRAELLALQRRWCADVPPGCRGVAMEGRDIGTIVCPDADVKLYLTGAPEVRAERRLAQQGGQDILSIVAAQLAVRDQRDLVQPGIQRADAPGVHVIDTTLLDAAEVLRTVICLAEPAMRRMAETRRR